MLVRPDIGLLWDQEEHNDLVVTLRQQETDLQSMPYDLLQAGRLLAFNLGELFSWYELSGYRGTGPESAG